MHEPDEFVDYSAAGKIMQARPPSSKCIPHS